MSPHPRLRNPPPSHPMHTCHSLQSVPAAMATTLYYYVGLAYMYNEQLEEAEVALRHAFRLCHSEYGDNKRAILRALIPVRRHGGSMWPRGFPACCICVWVGRRRQTQGRLLSCEEAYCLGGACRQERFEARPGVQGSLCLPWPACTVQAPPKDHPQHLGGKAGPQRSNQPCHCCCPGHAAAGVPPSG